MTKKKSKTNWEKRLVLATHAVRIVLLAVLTISFCLLYPDARTILDNGKKGSGSLAEALNNTAEITATAKVIPGKIADVVDGAKPMVSNATNALADASDAIRKVDTQRTLGKLDDLLDKADSGVEKVLGSADTTVKAAGDFTDKATALVVDLKDSMDGLYDDVSDTVQNAAVATAGIGRAADSWAIQAGPMTSEFADFVGHVGHISGTLDGAITRYFRPSPLRDRLLKLIPFAGEAIVLGKDAAK